MLISTSQFQGQQQSCITIAYNALCKKTKKIAQAIFGYFARILVFQLGAMDSKGSVCVIGCFETGKPVYRKDKVIDPTRLNEGKKFLEKWKEEGGEDVKATGQTKNTIHTMSFKASTFFKKFEGLKAERTTCTFNGEKRNCLLPPEATDKETKNTEDFEKALQKFGVSFKTVKINDIECKAALLPETNRELEKTEEEPICILHTHSPGRSMCMDRKVIWLHLAAGYDITVWDPRGTEGSVGRATEKGIYLDAEAVYQQVKNKYAAQNIYLSGFCQGAAINAHLFKAHIDERVNFVAHNTFSSMKALFEHQGYCGLGKLTAKYGLEALKDSDDTDAIQDGFDTQEKFKNIKEKKSRTNKVILIDTDKDYFVPEKSTEVLESSLKDKVESIKRITNVHGPTEKKSAHALPPYENEATWAEYVKHLTYIAK